MDEQREELFQELLKDYVMTLDRREEWTQTAHPEIRQAVGHLNGSFMRQVLPELLANGFDDVDFLEDCHGGFPFVGELPPVKYGTNPSSKKMNPISVQELVDHTQFLNEDVIASVRTSKLGTKSGSDWDSGAAAGG